MNNTANEEPLRLVQIRLDDDLIATIQDMTKVDAVATAAVAVIRRAAEEYRRSAAKSK